MARTGGREWDVFSEAEAAFWADLDRAARQGRFDFKRWLRYPYFLQVRQGQRCRFMRSCRTFPGVWAQTLGISRAF